jgi:hypothetical protein
MGMHLALRVLIHPTEAEVQHRLRVIANDLDGQSIVAIEAFMNPPPPEARAQLRPGEEFAASIALNLSGVPIPRPTDYSVEVLIDGIHQVSVPFTAKEGVSI